MKMDEKTPYHRYFTLASGMGTVELVVALCVTAVAAAVLIPFYVNYAQQSMVLSNILPPFSLEYTRTSSTSFGFRFTHC